MTRLAAAVETYLAKLRKASRVLFIVYFQRRLILTGSGIVFRIERADYIDGEARMDAEQEEKWKAVYKDARILANIYVHAVAMQISRVRQEVSDSDLFIMRQFVDLEFLLVTLVRLKRAACAIREVPVAREAMQQVIKEYDRRLPALKNLRDITEHYDDYLLEQGRISKADRSGLLARTIRSGLLTKIMSPESIDWMGYSMNLNEIMAAAEALFQEIKAIEKAIG